MLFFIYFIYYYIHHSSPAAAVRQRRAAFHAQTIRNIIWQKKILKGIMAARVGPLAPRL
jgi:hypothetical protein